jgi:ABC-2 type transport system permease protein
MKIIDIALKDLLRSTRSTFTILFMFGVPLLVTGMFYFMFGNIFSGDVAFDLPVARVVVVNQDEGSPEMQMGTSMFGLPEGAAVSNLGDLVVHTLNTEELANYLIITKSSSPDYARAAVDNREADIALIIPPDFTSKFIALESSPFTSEIELYADPEKIIELGILQSILEKFMSILSGAKIAASVTANQLPDPDFSLIGMVVQNYVAEAGQRLADPRTFIFVESLTQVDSQSPNQVLAIVGPIMAGMMIFYAFYTGMTTAETILREDEEGTLPRLFTTPTSRTAILAGKFLAVGITVLVQVVVLIIAASLIFKVEWGNPLYVTLIALGTVLAASAFGIFANSLIKSTKQGGAIYGGLLTVTGMLGMIRIFTMGTSNPSPMMDVVSLLVPQGWAVRGMLQNSTGAEPSTILITLLVLLVWSLVFFIIGAWRFHRRFA